MVPRPRVGAWPKVIRAEEQLAAIKAEIDFYREGDPYQIAGEFEPDGMAYVAWVQLRDRAPMRLPVLIGEFIYNLHSALDHLADYWVRANDGTPTEHTYFPIHTVPLTPKKDGAPIHPQPVGGVSERIAAILDALQPYQRGEDADWHPLAILRYLSRMDKHRALLVTESVLEHITVVLSFDDVMLTQTAWGNLNEGAVARFPLSAPVPIEQRSEVKVYGQSRLLVTFAEPAPPLDAVVLDTLTEILEFIREEVVGVLGLGA